MYRDEARKLVSENEQLKETLEKISIECENHLKVIAKKEEEASLFREKNFSLSSQLKIQEKQSEEKLKQLEKQKETLESQSFCLQEEITRLKKQLNQSEKSKDQLQHDYNEALKRITELEKELDKPVADTPQLPKTIQTEKLVFHSEIEIFNFIKPYTSYPSSLRKNDRISAIKDRSKFCSDLERLYGIVLWQKIPRIQTIKELVSIIWNITQSRKQP